jgi:hypothetical protein
MLPLGGWYWSRHTAPESCLSSGLDPPYRRDLRHVGNGTEMFFFLQETAGLILRIVTDTSDLFLTLTRRDVGSESPSFLGRFCSENTVVRVVGKARSQFSV